MSVKKDVWFARRFPIGHARNNVAPINWKGYAAFGAFAAAMVVGAAGWFASAATGQFWAGVALFGSLTTFGTGMLFLSVAQHTDTERTVEDYQKAKTNA